MASSLATTHDMPDLRYSPFLATFETPGYARFPPLVALSGGSDMSALAPLLGDERRRPEQPGRPMSTQPRSGRSQLAFPVT
jgi:hypothetical protein